MSNADDWRGALIASGEAATEATITARREELDGARDYRAGVRRLTARLDRLREDARSRYRVLDVRCPVQGQGCLLGTIYGIPERGGGDLLAFRGRLRAGGSKDGLLDWRRPGAPRYWLTSCAHGDARLDRKWLGDQVRTTRRFATLDRAVLDQAASVLSKADRASRLRGVLHPDGVSWRPRS